jgi:hypothetical protein
VLRPVLVLFLLLVTVPLVGCGGDATALDPIAEAAQKTSDVSGTRFSMTAKISENGGESIEFRGPGEIADHGKKLHMKMTMPARILGMKGVQSGDVALDMVSAGGAFYFRGGPFDQIAPGKWVRVEDNDPQFNLGQNDPSKMLEYLRTTSKVDKVGTEQVRGVETTHYEARIQLDKIADRVSPEARAALEQIKKTIGSKEIPIDVWVDGQGLVRRITMDWHPRGGSIALKLDLFDFGDDIVVDVPAKSDTTALTDLMGRG